MLAFLAPAVLLETVFVVIPSIRALGYSLQRWDGLGEPQWVWLENFAALLRDRELFAAALSHNLVLLFIGGPCIVGLALLFASLIHRRTRGAGLFRATFFFPNVMATVAVALLWLLLYSTTSFGVINAALIALRDGLAAWGVPWPGPDLPFAFIDSRNLIWSLVPMLVWMLTGFYMVLFLAAMEGIPETYYEAARLEGATGWQQFRHVTLPLIREVMVVGCVFLVITLLKFFDPVWVMENQWPTAESHVLATLLYQKVFSEYDVGYGAAVAVVLFALVLAATLITLRWGRTEAVEY
jgi:raffinose/stachyose/melibiose transport system permease protein